MSAILNQSVPDFIDFSKASEWLERGLKQDVAPGSKVTSVSWSDIAEEKDAHFGLYSSVNWRKFVLATYLADLKSYSVPVDQVAFDRLAFVMHKYPQGFRTWFIELQDKTWLPVGYTGWYPMLETAYEVCKSHPEQLKDRTFVPLTESKYVYLFNFSVHPSCKNSSLSRALMERFVEDIEKVKAEGLACITVSSDGERIAKRFRMQKTGSLSIDGSIEGVFVTCSQNDPQ